MLLCECGCPTVTALQGTLLLTTTGQTILDWFQSSGTSPLLNEAVRRFEEQRERLERTRPPLPVQRLLADFSAVAQEGVFDDLDT